VGVKVRDDEIGIFTVLCVGTGTIGTVLCLQACASANV